MNGIKVNILTTGRFHLLDLARELANQKVNVRFYSYVPKSRCELFGLPKKCSVSLLWIALPFLFIEKFVGKSSVLTRMKNYLLDVFLACFMRDCDVLILLGSVFNYSIKRAKKRGIVTILEWGSLHILDQIEMFKKDRPLWNTQNELWEYQACDYISIAGKHVEKTFIDRGVCPNKLIVNPYGVNLEDFYPTECTKEYDLLFVGGWRYEKGCDLIIELCKKHPNLKFLHVGSIVGLEFPLLNNMTHVDAVDQKILVEYYKKAKIFVLPSRADGFGMVLIQALACGLPIVASNRTGASTIQDYLLEKEWINVMESIDIVSLEKCVTDALSQASRQNGLRNYSNECINSFSWEAYGRRYYTNLMNIQHEDKRHNC